MNRLGVSLDEATYIGPLLRQHPAIKELVLMTHFSESEQQDPNRTLEQSALFYDVLKKLPYTNSLANSGAILQHSASHSDWVRPGIILYGASPIAAYQQQLQPVMTLTAPVLSVRTLQAGESAGYNCRWTAQRETRLATIGIGYGDGYPRHAKNGTPVIINGQRATLAGTVSMDLITVDISNCGDVAVGDTAELWGEQLSSNEVAEWADTISYALFTGVTARVTRRYINS